MTRCPAAHPEAGQCIFDGEDHDPHTAGYGSARVRWPNEGWTAPVDLPPPPKVERKQVIELVRRARGGGLRDLIGVLIRQAWDHSGLSAETSMDEVRDWLADRVSAGTTCPCCGQYAKVYRRTINAGMVESLLAMVAAGGAERPIHLPSTISSTHREEAKLRHWEMVERVIREHEGSQKSFWKVTGLGMDFLCGAARVHKYAVVYNNELLTLEGDLISVDDVKGFDMRNVTDSA